MHCHHQMDKWTKQLTGQLKMNTKPVIALHLQNFHRAQRYFTCLNSSECKIEWDWVSSARERNTNAPVVGCTKLGANSEVEKTFFFYCVSIFYSNKWGHLGVHPFGPSFAFIKAYLLSFVIHCMVSYGFGNLYSPQGTRTFHLDYYVLFIFHVVMSYSRCWMMNIATSRGHKHGFVEHGIPLSKIWYSYSNNNAKICQITISE